MDLGAILIRRDGNSREYVIGGTFYTLKWDGLLRQQEDTTHLHVWCNILQASPLRPTFRDDHWPSFLKPPLYQQEKNRNNFYDGHFFYQSAKSTSSTSQERVTLTLILFPLVLYARLQPRTQSVVQHSSQPTTCMIRLWLSTYHPTYIPLLKLYVCMRLQLQVVRRINFNFSCVFCLRHQRIVRHTNSSRVFACDLQCHPTYALVHIKYDPPATSCCPTYNILHRPPKKNSIYDRSTTLIWTPVYF